MRIDMAMTNKNREKGDKSTAKSKMFCDFRLTYNINVNSQNA